ncbi:hypothetical protein T484DRAFT_1668163, partial [Baffinella frigidus]
MARREGEEVRGRLRAADGELRVSTGELARWEGGREATGRDLDASREAVARLGRELAASGRELEASQLAVLQLEGDLRAAGRDLALARGLLEEEQTKVGELQEEVARLEREVEEEVYGSNTKIEGLGGEVERLALQLDVTLALLATATANGGGRSAYGGSPQRGEGVEETLDLLASATQHSEREGMVEGRTQRALPAPTSHPSPAVEAAKQHSEGAAVQREERG